MQPRVTAVLVARNGAQYLPRTLAALAAQTRRPDSVIHVDTSSSDSSSELLVEADPTQLVTTPGRRSLGAAIAQAMRVANPPKAEHDWLWLLGHDNAPEPGALAALLGAVEVAPSVAVAGPKLMRWDDPTVIAGFGETLTRFGRSIALVTNELDQAQHDLRSDVLGVAASGLLVRSQVWNALGGFDPGLPSVDAALDFSLRARLAGHRVIGVPSARVASAGPAELFGRRSLSGGAQNRLRRSAQLHRRLVYAPALAVPLHWLVLVPLAVLRSLVQLLAKRPGFIGGELAAAIAAAFDPTVPAARRTLRRARALGWAAIRPLRMPWSQLRELRAQERAAEVTVTAADRVRPGFFAGGGAWVVLLAAIAGAIAFGRFVGAQALGGGGLLPLSATVGQLWSQLGYGWRDVGTGFLGAADPFSYLLAVLGSLTWWLPSFSVVALYLVALPLAALAAWWCAARFSAAPWPPAIAAIAWAAAPPFLAALGGGQLGAAIAHILLPSLVLAVVNAARSWSASAAAALLFAGIAAAAPVLVPALLAAWLLWLFARPTSVLRLIGIPIPAAALFAPLIVQQLGRGNVLALLADPGVPVAGAPASGWQLALGSPTPGSSGWEAFLASFGQPGALAPLIVTVLLLPLVALAVLALFLPGTARSVPAMLLALLGFVTAVGATRIEVSIIGSATTPIWPGSGLSLYWLGLVGSLAVAIEVLGRRAALPALAAGVGIVLLALPLFVAAASGAIAVTASKGRLLPAFVTAEAASRPSLGTLELTAQPSGALAARVQRGYGTTLDQQSTLDATATRLSESDARIATLAGNLASRSGFDVAAELDALQIAFILVAEASSDAEPAARHRVTGALDGNRLLTPIGNTANGYLWNYGGLGAGKAPSGPASTGTTLGLGLLIGQGVVFGLTLLLAIPTTRRRRVRTAVGPGRAGSDGPQEVAASDD